MSNTFCVNYLVFLTFAGVLFLVLNIQSYIGFLCLFDSKEIPITNKYVHGYTVLIAAAMYLFFFVIMIGIKFKKRTVVHFQDYQALDSFEH
jgi:hypothetical protein